MGYNIPIIGILTYQNNKLKINFFQEYLHGVKGGARRHGGLGFLEPHADIKSLPKSWRKVKVKLDESFSTVFLNVKLRSDKKSILKVKNKFSGIELLYLII